MAPLQPLTHLIDPLFLATRTLVEQAPSRVLRRQSPATVTVITAPGGNPGQLSGGEIAGIVIGSVFGFLLIVWLLHWSCSQREIPDEKPSYYHQDISPRRHRSHSHHHHHHHRHRSRHSRSRSRSRGPEVRVITTHTTHPNGCVEPVEPTRVYYEKRRRSHSRY